MPAPTTQPGGLMQYLSSLNPNFSGNQGGAAMEMSNYGQTPQQIGAAMQSPGWNQNRFAGGPLAPGFGPNAAGGGGKRDMVSPPPAGAPAPPQGQMDPRMAALMARMRGKPQLGAKTGAPTPSAGAGVPAAPAQQQQGQQQQMMAKLMQNPQFMQAIMPHIMKMFSGGPSGLAALSGNRQMGVPAL